MPADKKLSVLILLFVVFLTGALVVRNTTPKSTITNPSPPQGSSLTQNTWELIEYADITNDQPVPKSFIATAIFDSEGQVGGSGGCNSYSANYSVDGNKLSISEIQSTLMACENSSDLESVYTRHLQNANTYEIKEGFLVIIDMYGNTILKFKKV